MPRQHPKRFDNQTANRPPKWVNSSQRNALRLVKMSASTYLYQPVKKDESALKMRIKEITDTRVHYGYRRVHVMLRREGHMDNVKRVYRLYREEGLSICVP